MCTKSFCLAFISPRAVDFGWGARRCLFDSGVCVCVVKGLYKDRMVLVR